ncbi:MAG: homoprotocatechuate degradation operon regulator HpaR [Arenibacterium sp.]
MQDQRKYLMSKPVLSTSRSLPIALLRARESVLGPFRTLMADVDITEQQWRVLRVLDENGPMEPTRIAEEACLLLPSLTRILQKLEQKKMIQRKTDKMDRRRQIVRIAPAGTKLIAANLERSADLLEEMRQKMGSERWDKLLDLLHELHEAQRRDWV